jgi:hypothetical protein
MSAHSGPGVAGTDRKGDRMPNYLLSFHGGSMPEDQEEGVRVMAAWTAWYEELGPAVVDPGNPIGRAMTIEADGTVNEGAGANQVSGYSILKADDMDRAIEMGRNCPIFLSDGTLEIGETFEVM